MKVLKVLGNIIGVLISIVLSLALLVSLIAAPVLSGVTEMIQNDTLISVMQSIVQMPSDPETPSLPDSSVKPQLPDFAEGEWAEKLLETELVEKLINMYMDDFMAASMGDNQVTLTVESMKALVEEHMHELLPIVRQAVTESGEEMSDQEIEDAIHAFVDESGQELIDSLPSPEDLDIDEDAALALSLFRGNLLRVGVSILIAALSILILLFRFPRFKGFMWLAVVYILGALSAFGVNFGASLLLPQLLLEQEPMLADILLPALLAFSKACKTGGVIMLVLAVVFILIFAFGRKALKKRKARKAAAAAEPAAAAPAAVAEETPVAVPSYVMKGAAAAEKAAEEPAVESVAEPAAEPVAEPAAEPVAETENEVEPEL